MKIDGVKEVINSIGKRLINLEFMKGVLARKILGHMLVSSNEVIKCN